MRYALIKSGIVVNVVEWDGTKSYSLPSGVTAVAATIDAQPGGTWDGANFTRPAPDEVILSDRDMLGDAVEAMALITLSEINLIRGWFVSFKAAVAAATNLANLQTRVAALPDMPDRTVQQLVTAVRNKMTDGSLNA